MKLVVFLSVLLIAIGCSQAAEPVDRGLVDKIARLERENQLLRAELAELKRRINAMDGPAADGPLPQQRAARVPPMVDVELRVPGSWVFHPQTGMLVRTRSVYHTYRRGRAQYTELVELNGIPVPIDTVIFGKQPGGGAGDARPPINYNFGGQVQGPSP